MKDDALTITIVAPAVADAAAIASFAQACFSDTFAYMNYPPEDLAAFLAMAMSEAAFAKRIADPSFCLRIARHGDGTIVGFATIGPNALPMPDGEPDPALTRELYQLYLDPSTHGTGLANQMMQVVFDDAAAHDARAIYLSVYAGNARAQRFYAKHGFAELCETIFMVGNTADDERIWKCAL
jgi:ribosomal protein S18 acetylase RimI-like enzyme